MRRRLLIVLPLVLLAGCGEEVNQPKKPVPPPPKPPAPTSQLQRDINATEVSEIVGYDGAAMKGAVQRSVDLQQQQNQRSADAQAAAGQ